MKWPKKFTMSKPMHPITSKVANDKTEAKLPPKWKLVNDTETKSSAKFFPHEERGLHPEQRNKVAKVDAQDEKKNIRQKVSPLQRVSPLREIRKNHFQSHEEHDNKAVEAQIRKSHLAVAKKSIASKCNLKRAEYRRSQDET
jgi:hypothetical protein